MVQRRILVSLLLLLVFASTHDHSLALALQQPNNVVMNPTTMRRIQVHGPAFRRCLDKGYIFHNDTLYPIQPGKYPEPIRSTTWNIIEPTANRRLDQEEVVTTHKWILLVDKPSGLLTVPGRVESDCLLSRVQETYPSAKVCHRLDRDTSGVLAMALDAQTHRDISKQFETRQTTKQYTALVAGHVPEENGTVDLPIGKAMTDEGYNRWVIGGSKPREAQTEWNVEARLQVPGFCYTRVVLRPLTGRGHQIRLHMQAMGHPLLGDTLHAPEEIATATPRLCLHATKLKFQADGVPVEASIPSPF
eukprot:scaffold1087_cov154-Amphora_coffeaeformis.AAC.10